MLDKFLSRGVLHSEVAVLRSEKRFLVNMPKFFGKEPTMQSFFSNVVASLSVALVKKCFVTIFFQENFPYFFRTIVF